MEVTMQLLGRGVIAHHKRQAQPPTRKWNISSNLCVHLVEAEDKTLHPCGKAVATDAPNGWLCADHQLLLQPKRKVVSNG